MSLGNFDTFVNKYNNVKADKGFYYGVDVSKYHIHAKSIIIENDIKKVLLKDIKGHTIACIPIDDIMIITFCKANYWDICGTLYYKGWDD